MNSFVKLILLIIVIYFAYLIYEEHYSDDKDNYVSLYTSLGPKGAILGDYIVNYVYKPSCRFCKMYSPSFTDQISFLQDINTKITCNIYNIDNELDRQRLMRDGIYESVTNFGTVPYVSIIKDRNINTLLTLDDSYRDDIYNYIYAMDNNKMDYYDQITLTNMLRKERHINNNNNLFKLTDYVVKYTPSHGLNQWGDYYIRRFNRGKYRNMRRRRRSGRRSRRY